MSEVAYTATKDELLAEISKLKSEISRINEKIEATYTKQTEVENDEKLGIYSEHWNGLQNEIVGLLNEQSLQVKRLRALLDEISNLPHVSPADLMAPPAPASSQDQILSFTTDDMVESLITVVKEAIDEKAERLNMFTLSKLVGMNWCQILGRHKSRTCKSLDGVNFEYLINQEHGFSSVYRSALDHLSNMNTSESSIKDWRMKIFEDVFTTMSQLKPHFGARYLEKVANASFSDLSGSWSTSTKKSNSIADSDPPPSKRFKPSSDSSVPTRSVSSASFSPSADSSTSVLSDSSISSSWPDLLIKDKTSRRVYFVRELKLDLSRGDAVEAKLTMQAVQFNSVNNHRDNTFHSFGAIVGHESIYLFYFRQKEGCLKRELIANFDLNYASDRIRLVTNLIVLHSIMSLLAERLINDANLYVDKLYPTIYRKTCSLQFLEDKSVLKLIDLTTLECKFRLKDQRGHLEKLYSELKEDHQSSIVNSLKCKEFKHFAEHNTLLVHLWPRGAPLTADFVLDNIERFVTDVLAFLESFHSFGYVHCDIRLANIVSIKSKDETGKRVVKFIVIDYENIHPICKYKKSDGSCQIHGNNSRSCVATSTDFYSLVKIIRCLLDENVTSSRTKSLPIDLEAFFATWRALKKAKTKTFDANIIRGFFEKQQK